METKLFFSPFASPYTLDEDTKFRAFYTGEPFHYVQKRIIGYTVSAQKVRDCLISTAS